MLFVEHFFQRRNPSPSESTALDLDLEGPIDGAESVSSLMEFRDQQADGIISNIGILRQCPE